MRNVVLTRSLSATVVFYNLKTLIKAIRATKTIADERALIVKESAVIRTSFKEEGESSESCSPPVPSRFIHQHASTILK